MYRAAGYREIPDYNSNPHADRWYEKCLACVSITHLPVHSLRTRSLRIRPALWNPRRCG